MKDNIKYGDKLLKAVGSIDSISDGIRVDKSDKNIEGFAVGTSDDATLGLFDSNILGVADSSKLGGERGCKETASLVVPDWYDVGIPEGDIFCNYLGNDE